VPNGSASIVISEEGFWVPRTRPRGTDLVPDLTEFLLGTALARRKPPRERPADTDLGELLVDCNDVDEARRRLGLAGMLIPFTAIVRVYVYGAGRLRRPKLALEYFVARSGRMSALEFGLYEEDIDDLVRDLSLVVPDRLELC
jgi:hypothetical protein